MNPVLKMINDDKCQLVEVKLEVGLALIRFRTPVLGGVEMPGYNWRLAILWPYADAGSGAWPTRESMEEMDVFETRLCEAFEKDAHAVLVAVVTLDGARQWVFYTSSVEECVSRLNYMPQADEPYPLEIEGTEDPKWLYLREEILSHVNFDV